MKYVIIFLFTILLIFPIYWMFSGSIQDLGMLMKTPPNWIPKNVTLANFQHLADVSLEGMYTTAKEGGSRALPVWTINTFLIFAMKCSISILLVSTAGYAFAVYRFRHKNWLLLFFIVGMFLGPAVTIVPDYVVVKRLGLSGTWWGVVLPFAYMPVGMYIFKNYVETIPSEMIDAARIDGAGEYRILFRIMMPLCKPVMGVLVVLTALGTLQDYIWTLLMIPEREKQTLMVGIIEEVQKASALSGGRNPIGISLAGGVIIFIPLFLIFLFCQRYFIKGLTLGGIK